MAPPPVQLPAPQLVLLQEKPWLRPMAPPLLRRVALTVTSRFALTRPMSVGRGERRLHQHGRVLLRGAEAGCRCLAALAAAAAAATAAAASLRLRRRARLRRGLPLAPCPHTWERRACVLCVFL